MATSRKAGASSANVESPIISPAASAFEATRLRYDEAGKTTKALGYWKEAYPHPARLVQAYIVEAFAKNGCALQSLRPGDTVPEVKALPQHKQLLRRFHEVLEGGKVISSKDGGFVRTESPIDPKPAETIYQEIINLFLQHAATNKLVKVV